jgi:NADH-quinone oxidoreductase subunit G
MTDTAQETLTITLDGKPVTAAPGEMIIAAADRAGVYIPHFCYHPRMKPVGMCRMCLVEVNSPRGPQLIPSCFVAVADGQEVVTDSERVKKAQTGVLEFLLVNHPLDCPVCDKGGECPLQDQTFAYGPGESRFVEEKRHWEKPIALSDLVLLDRERCIQCSRCTRFADEIAGDPLIEFINRGERTEVNTFPDEPFSSYFSGNTVQICPVGALTSSAYRFKARPWDLEEAESTCTTCSVGCRMSLQSSADKLVRYMGIDSDPVNQGWLCDKGRYNFEAVHSDKRLRAPMIRKEDESIEVSWAEAIADIATAVEKTLLTKGPSAIGFVGGARLANEDAYLWAKLAKGVVGTDNVDAQLADGLPAELVLGLPQATIDDVCSAKQIVLLCPDLKDELPVLYLRIRQAVLDKKVPLLEITSRPTGLTKYATRSVSYMPGEVATTVQNLIAEGAVDESAVVVVGRASVAESVQSLIGAVSQLIDFSNLRFLPVLRRGNVRGALELGLAPNIMPGRIPLENSRRWYDERWSSAPASGGLDTSGIFHAASEGKISVLFLLGADPLNDLPDHEGEKVLRKIPYVVAIQSHENELSSIARVTLPAATFGERGGTTTNLEGRVSHLAAKVTPPGVAWADWAIAAELASQLGVDFALNSLEDIQNEIASVVPSFDGITAAAIKQNSKGFLINKSRLATAPEPVQFHPNRETQNVPRTDQYALRIISSRSLYDAGTSVQLSPSLQAIATELAVHLNPSDLSRLGVNSGDLVRVRNERMNPVRIRAISDPSTPKGCVWMPYATRANGIRANAFVDNNAVVNDLFVETDS